MCLDQHKRPKSSESSLSSNPPPPTRYLEMLSHHSTHSFLIRAQTSQQVDRQLLRHQRTPLTTHNMGCVCSALLISASSPLTAPGPGTRPGRRQPAALNTAGCHGSEAAEEGLRRAQVLKHLYLPVVAGRQDDLRGAAAQPLAMPLQAGTPAPCHSTAERGTEHDTHTVGRRGAAHGMQCGADSMRGAGKLRRAWPSARSLRRMASQARAAPAASSLPHLPRRPSRFSWSATPACARTRRPVAQARSKGWVDDSRAAQPALAGPCPPRQKGH